MNVAKPFPVVGLLFFFLFVTPSQAQFRTLEPGTGQGNPSLKNLKPGFMLGDLVWDSGEFQDGWCTSYLGAEGQAPAPKYPHSDDPEESSADNDALIRWSDMYAPRMAQDGSGSTAWVEGKKGPGIGEILMVPVKDGQEVTIMNGFQKSADLFKKNGRVNLVRIWVLAGKMGATQFGVSYEKLTVLAQGDTVVNDVMGSQVLKLPTFTVPQSVEGRPVGLVLALQILSVYPGSKYEDTCISEIGPGLW